MNTHIHFYHLQHCHHNRCSCVIFFLSWKITVGIGDSRQGASSSLEPKNKDNYHLSSTLQQLGTMYYVSDSVIMVCLTEISLRITEGRPIRLTLHCLWNTSALGAVLFYPFIFIIILKYSSTSKAVLSEDVASRSCRTQME